MFKLCIIVLPASDFPCCLYSLSPSGVMWGIPPPPVFLLTLDSWRYLSTTAGLLSLFPKLGCILGTYLCKVCTVFQWNVSSEPEPSLCTDHVWINFPESTLQNNLRMDYIFLELCWSYGCSLVTGCVDRVSVAPWHGEQPVPGLSCCRSPCSQWSMTIHVFTKTYLLSLPQGWWCSYQHKRSEVCFPVWFILMVLFHSSKCFISSLRSVEFSCLILYSLGQTTNHALYLMTGYMSATCITLFELIVSDLFVLIFSVILSILLCFFSLSGMHVFLLTNFLQFYYRISILQYGLWWNWASARWDLCYLIQDVLNFCYIMLFFVIYNQLRFVLFNSLLCCKCNRATISKRSMVSEVIGLFMFFTSKARFQTAYGLRPSVTINRFLSLPNKKILALSLSPQGLNNCQVLYRLPMPQPISCV